FPHASPVIGLPAGSRRSVAAANFPRQLEVARQILREFPDAKFLVPTTDATDALVSEAIARVDSNHGEEVNKDSRPPSLGAIKKRGSGTFLKKKGSGTFFHGVLSTCFEVRQ